MTGTSIKTIMAFALLVGVASQANADIWAHIDRQANDIERAAKNLRTEVNHYRHTRFYGQLIGATARLKGQAIRVHNIADHAQCPKQLKHAVRDLDRAFLDAESLFDRVEIGASRGDGYIRGNTAHVKRQLNAIARCIENLKSDLYQLNHGHVARRATYQPRVAPVYVSPVRHDVYRSGRFNEFDWNQRYGGFHQDRGCRDGRNRNSGFSFSIGGGSSRLTFGF